MIPFSELPNNVDIAIGDAIAKGAERGPDGNSGDIWLYCRCGSSDHFIVVNKQRCLTDSQYSDEKVRRIRAIECIAGRRV